MENLKVRASNALHELEDTVVELLAAAPGGLTNIDVTTALGLHSDHLGNHRNYLSWSILGRLMNSDRVRGEKDEKGKLRYFSNK
jgi:hypothetical protein